MKNMIAKYAGKCCDYPSTNAGYEDACFTEETPYGLNQIGIPYRSRESGGFERIDTYTSRSEGKPTQERRFALDANDRSPMARNYDERGNCHYHARCSCCWLGFSHTLALHQNQSV